MMEKKKQMNPRIRFKGFEDDWEQRKLGELTEQTIGGGTPSKKIRDFWQGDIPWIQSSNVQLEHLVLKKAEIKQFISKRALKESAAKLISKNSISIVTRVGVGKIAYVPFQYATSQDFLTLVGLRISPLFLLYKLYVMMPFMGEVAQGTSIKGVTKPELLVMKLNVPTKTIEQDKIGQILTEVDSLIAANEKNVGQLKLLKRLLLQKLFSVEWRFKGFKDHWEQRKLNEIAVINPSESLPSRFYYIDLDAVNRGRITNRKKLSLAEAPSRAQRVAHLQDVFFQNVRPYQKNNVIYSNSSIPTVFSSGYTQIRTKIDSEFMISALEDDLFVHNVLMHSTGTSYPAISSKQLGALQLFIPEKKETEYVGSLFNVVDNLIAANEDKLERLKQVKKFLMQNLFV